MTSHGSAPLSSTVRGDPRHANPRPANPPGLELAASMWRDFPVAAQPRPLVLTDPPFGAGTFTTEAARLAIRDGLLSVDDSLPPGVVAALRMAGLLRGDRSGSDIQVTSALLSTMGFGTDRGGRQLPAWLLSITEIDGPCYAMDAESQALAYPAHQPVTPVHKVGGYAKLLGDGLTVRVDFDPPWLTRNGGPALTAVDVLETATSVVFAPTADSDAVAGDATLHPERPTALTLRLVEPLGARVLSDAGGSPLIVARRKRNSR